MSSRTNKQPETDDQIRTEASSEGAIDFGGWHEALHQVTLIQPQGAIVRVAGLTVESAGPKVSVGQLCEIQMRDKRKVLAEVVGFHGDQVVLMPLEHMEGIAQGDVVTPHRATRRIRVGDRILGRVLNGLGQPIDGKGPLQGDDYTSLDGQVPSPMTRDKISLPLALGIRSIDGMLTVGRGQRVGIFSGSGVGKSVLLGDIANSSDAEINVVALIGERGREVREFLENELGPEGLARSVVVVSTSDAPAIQRAKAAFMAASLAEYFRDKGRNVLFMMDSLTRFCQAQREIGLAAGEPPTAKGYCPSVFSLMPRLIERLGCSDKGSITGILTVLVESDDMSDPVADSARSLLDGHIVLSRRLAERGHYPAVDVMASISRLMPAVVSEEHNKAARKLKEIYATYMDAEDLINIGMFSSGSNARIDGSIALIDQIRNFLIQPMRQRCPFDETVQQLLSMTRVWDELLSGPRVLARS
ncbi:MAG: FliI/YscN family ATPase [Phycisphaerae bacterium]|nr:FliI/YscN family ATPase [Phycisphaerae bacterium]